MTDTPTLALKALKETLKTPIQDAESLVESLRACLGEIGLGEDSGATETKTDLGHIRRAVQRYLPSIQVQIPSEVYPTFHHALEDSQTRLLRQFFVPERATDPKRLAIGRSIALCSYLTIPSFLNASSTPPLPAPSRLFLLDILNHLARDYGIEEMYWAVRSSESAGKGKRKTGPQELMWEEVVKNLASVPAKSANAVGRWKSEGWAGELPERLEAKSVALLHGRGSDADELDLSSTTW